MRAETYDRKLSGMKAAGRRGAALHGMQSRMCFRAPSAEALAALARCRSWFRDADIRASGPQFALSCTTLAEYARLFGDR